MMFEALVGAAQVCMDPHLDHLSTSDLSALASKPFHDGLVHSVSRWVP